MLMYMHINWIQTPANIPFKCASPHMYVSPLCRSLKCEPRVATLRPKHKILIAHNLKHTYTCAHQWVNCQSGYVSYYGNVLWFRSNKDTTHTHSRISRLGYPIAPMPTCIAQQQHRRIHLRLINISWRQSDGQRCQRLCFVYRERWYAGRSSRTAASQSAAAAAAAAGGDDVNLERAHKIYMPSFCPVRVCVCDLCVWVQSKRWSLSTRARLCVCLCMSAVWHFPHVPRDGHLEKCHAIFERIARRVWVDGDWWWCALLEIDSICTCKSKVRPHCSPEVCGTVYA